MTGRGGGGSWREGTVGAPTQLKCIHSRAFVSIYTKYARCNYKHSTILKRNLQSARSRAADSVKGAAESAQKPSRQLRTYGSMHQVVRHQPTPLHLCAEFLELLLVRLDGVVHRHQKHLGVHQPQAENNLPTL